MIEIPASFAAMFSHGQPDSTIELDALDSEIAACRAELQRVEDQRQAYLDVRSGIPGAVYPLS